uniref:Uncharacterized protein n=1 Tax=Lyophyllum decastes TaxID=64660 RepID=A0A2Z4HH37_LYODE|nr:hypothetical protein [Lyophyllum decastes]AWW14088.1 hypothetical protein [Lyophyllum decastes]
MIKLILLISIIFLCINIRKVLRLLRSDFTSPTAVQPWLKKDFYNLNFGYRIILLIILIYKINHILPLLISLVFIKFLFFFLLSLTYFNELIIFIIVYYPSLLCNLKLKDRKVCPHRRERANKLKIKNYNSKKLNKIKIFIISYLKNNIIKNKNLLKHLIFKLKKYQVLEYFIFFIIKILKIIYILNIYFFGLELLLYFNISNYYPSYFKNIAYLFKFSFSGIDSNINTNTNTFNFNTLSLNEKYEYIKLKFFNKAIEPNIPFLEWFIQLLVNTDGSQNNVDQIIETNLNKIQKIEREAQLNSHSFSRIRPFLINKTDTSSTQMPNIIPYKDSSYYDE